MAWSTPIIDRAQSDIDSRTSKGFFNVVDWTRIYDNEVYLHDFLVAWGYDHPNLYTLTAPNYWTIPTVVLINQLIDNINILESVSYLPTGLGLVHLKHDYKGGANQIAPNFTIVNGWENKLKILYDALPKAVNYRVHCGVGSLAVGQERLWQYKFR